MKQKKNKMSTLLLSVIFALQVCCPQATPAAVNNPADQPGCVQQLQEAEEFYYNGEFDKALIKIEECLAGKPTDKPLLIRAYTIITRIYLVREDQSSAEKYLSLILDQNPDYSPTIEEETPKYVNMVQMVRSKRAEKQQIPPVAEADSSGISPWVWIGAGGLGLITIIAIVSSNNGTVTDNPQSQPLPEPPGYPQ